MPGLSPSSQVDSGRQIATAVQHAIDRNATGFNMERDRHSSAITDDAQSRTKIVTARSALRKRRKSLAIGNYAISKIVRPSSPGLLRNVLIHLENILLCFRREDDLKGHA